MTNLASPLSTYSDTTPHRRVITDVISLIDPSDAPMVDALGGLDGASGKFRFTNGKGKVMEWLEDTLLPLSTTLAQDATLTSVTTVFFVTDGSIFQEGHIAKLANDELVWVSDVSTNTITVTRGVAGSTKASSTSTAAISIVGMARLEGDESHDIAFTDRVTNSNYTNIFHQEVKVSRSQRQLSQYGIADELDYQVDKIIPSLMRLIEKQTYESKGSAAGSATTPRIMSGIPGFVATNVASGASLTQAKIEDAIESAYSNGGTGPWLGFCNPATMQKIKNFYDSSNFLRVERSEGTLGMVVQTLVTPFGDLRLVMDRWCPSTLMPIIDEKHAGFVTYHPFTQEPLAKTGDFDRVEVVGEFSFCLRQEKAHALLTAVS